jgi:hypothetical protein
MKSITHPYQNRYLFNIIGFILLLAIMSSSCKKFLDIPVPVNSIAGSGAFANDKSTAAVLNGIYGNLTLSQIYDAGGAGTPGINSLMSLYTDEIKPTGTVTGVSAYQDAIGTDAFNGVWKICYQQLNSANLIIEAMRPASGTAFVSRNQWLGEALFLRALLHFNLVNYYGDVPITITSDYKLNNVVARSPKADVYKQIIADLQEAATFLPTDYRDFNGAVTTDRGRPDKWAAAALLARAYLYSGDYVNAEAQATLVINNSTTFQLTAPAQTFLINSKETIWAMTPNSPNPVRDYLLFSNNAPAVLVNTIDKYVPVVLRPELAGLFESGDTRFTNWIRTVVSGTTPATTYYLANKYKSSTAKAENIMIFRLAEQFLIRAEARAQQNNVSGSQSDINTIRTRAGLGNTTAATQTTLIAAIARERQLEFFTESSHRLFDLRRTGQLDAVMNVDAPKKGGTWSTFKQYFAIPTADLQNDPNLKQTPGY